MSIEESQQTNPTDIDKNMQLHEKMKTWVSDNAGDILEEARKSGVPEEKIDLAVNISAAFAVKPPKLESTKQILTQKAIEDPDNLDPDKYWRTQLERDGELSDLLHKIQERSHEIANARKLNKEFVKGIVGGVSDTVSKNLKGNKTF